MAERPSCRVSLSACGLWGQDQGAAARGRGRGQPQVTATPRHTHIKGQHLHRGVEELVFWVLDVPTAEEEPAARQACELLQGGQCPGMLPSGAEARPGQWARLATRAR